MRFATLSLFAAALLAGCGPSEPTAPPEAEAFITPPPAPPRIPEPAPEITLRPMDALPANSAQADADRQELDRRAATIQSDITVARQRADDAFRNARPPSLPPAASTPAAPAAPPPATPAPPEAAPATPG